MPPLMSDDESISDDLDTIPAKRVQKAAPVAESVADDEEEEEEEEEEENAATGRKDNEDDDDEGSDDEDGETFAVEEIMEHAWDAKTKGYLYKVKWLGYPKESDQTWEPMENLLEGAEDALNAYFTRVGGEPSGPPQPPKKGRVAGTKRKAESVTESPAPAKRERKSASVAINGTWKAPAGSWESEINDITTLSEEPVKDSKGRSNDELHAFITFNDGHKASYSIETVRQKCPQKLLDYFIAHLWVDGKQMYPPRHYQLMNPGHSKIQKNYE